MNPWLLHEVRKDDLAARYEEAERHRLAATLSNDPLSAADPGEPGARAGGRRSRLAVGLLAGIALVVVMIVASTCGTPAVPAVVAPALSAAPLETQPVPALTRQSLCR